MTDSDRIFLLSLASIAACGSDPSDPAGDTESTSDATGSGTMSTTVSPSTSSTSSSGTTESSSEGSETTAMGSESTTAPDTTSTTNETTSSTSDTTSDTSSESSSGSTGTAVDECADPESELVAACCSFFGFMAECNGYDLPLGYCDTYTSYVEPYGAECEAAVSELWTCLSMLECDDFVDVIPPACQATGLEAHETCPEFISYCADGFVGVGDDECEAGALNCLDGHTYGVSCVAGLCTCTIDDAEVGNFAGNAESCEAPDLGDQVVDNCGFPPDVFF